MCALVREFFHHLCRLFSRRRISLRIDVHKRLAISCWMTSLPLGRPESSLDKMRACKAGQSKNERCSLNERLVVRFCGRSLFSYGAMSHGHSWSVEILQPPELRWVTGALFAGDAPGMLFTYYISVEPTTGAPGRSWEGSGRSWNSVWSPHVLPQSLELIISWDTYVSALGFGSCWMLSVLPHRPRIPRRASPSCSYSQILKLKDPSKSLATEKELNLEPIPMLLVTLVIQNAMAIRCGLDPKELISRHLILKTGGSCTLAEGIRGEKCVIWNSIVYFRPTPP